MTSTGTASSIKPPCGVIDFVARWNEKQARPADEEGTSEPVWPIVLPTAFEAIERPAECFNASLGHPAIGLIDRISEPSPVAE